MGKNHLEKGKGNQQINNPYDSNCERKDAYHQNAYQSNEITKREI